MKKLSLYIAGLFVLIAISVYSCKKISGINNNTVVETPFSLYFSDTSGTLFLTNDGKTLNPVVFPPDGKPCRSLVTSGNNILWAKDSLYYSTNNGVNFNQSYDSVYWKPDTTVNNVAINLNQSMLINLPTWGNRVYVASRAPGGASAATNYMGLVYSDQNGTIGSWSFENTYDTANVGILPVRMYSFAQLTNGYLCGLAFEVQRVPGIVTGYNLRYERNFYKPAKDQDWREVTANPDGSGSIYAGNSAGRPLPPYGTSLTDSSFFTLGHLNNRLIAIDNRGKYGAYYSDDYGANWTAYTGLPANIPLLCISAPFEQTCLIGTDSAGLFVLNASTGVWQQNNRGLASNLIVRNIAFKEAYFKNNTVQKYIFLATNKGIFESVDGGNSWILTIPGNYVDIY